MGYIGSGRKLKACVPLSQLVLQMCHPGHKSSLWGRVWKGPRRSSPLTEDIQSEQPADAVGSLSLYKRSSILLKTSSSGKCECIFKSAGQRLNWSLHVQNPCWPLKRGKGTVPPLNCFLFIEEGTWGSIRKNTKKGAGRRKHPCLGRGRGGWAGNCHKGVLWVVDHSFSFPLFIYSL